MELPEALEVLAVAARKWNEELADYIIPNAEETSAEDSAGYTAQSDEIDEALAVVAGQRLLPVPGTSPSTYSLVPDDPDTAAPTASWSPRVCLDCGGAVKWTPLEGWIHVVQCEYKPRLVPDPNS